MSSSDEFLNIDTPENVIFGYEVVGIGSRFMAALLDSLIIIILELLVLFGMQIFFRILDEQIGNVFLAIYILLAFVLLGSYYIFFEMRWNGSSPGKRAVKLRVIRRDGTPITLSESIIRNLVRLVDFLPFAYGLGVITMFVDGQARRLGDLAAGTLVVREEAEVTLAALDKSSRMAQARPSLRAPGETENLAEQWPVDRLSSEDVQLIVEFLERQKSMSDPTPLANQILKRALAKMGMPEMGIRPSQAIYALDKIVRVYYDQSSVIRNP
ncbi:MAG: RDD family protein [Chloroflexi bacterium]|nr:RDD family protein [Ardenticatenaceae bacterium]MBL1128712.1 RDD family protein [Chloroflexota bacterium]NOG34790.1 RDD family protein [Chloroflexota bacterium]GIK57529.1 MAG: RDD family protein [Chloroflexota bacterium]